eukprot:6189481-Pleurochrysis_carterae.AAC.1
MATILITALLRLQLLPQSPTAKSMSAWKLRALTAELATGINSNVLLEMPTRKIVVPPCICCCRLHVPLP